MRKMPMNPKDSHMNPRTRASDFCKRKLVDPEGFFMRKRPFRSVRTRRMCLSEEEETSLSEDDLDDEEDTSLLPEVQKILGDEKPNLFKDTQERACLVCPTMQRRFKGWRALMAHAKTFQKKHAHRHRGYFKALEEVISPNAEQRDKVDIQETRIKQIPVRVSTSNIANSARNEQKVYEEEREALRKEKLRLWELLVQKEAIEQRRSELQITLERDRRELEELKHLGDLAEQRRDEEAKRDAAIFKRDMRELETKWEERLRRLEMKLNNQKTDSEIMERLRYLQELRKIKEKGTEAAKQQSQKLLELEEEKNRIENNVAAMTGELKEAFQAEELQLMEKHKKEMEIMEALSVLLDLLQIRARVNKSNAPVPDHQSSNSNSNSSRSCCHISRVSLILAPKKLPGDIETPGNSLIEKPTNSIQLKYSRWQ